MIFFFLAGFLVVLAATENDHPEHHRDMWIGKEAAKRDHRKIGVDQELFFFHPSSPGAVFWYPKGAMIYNKLCDFIRKQYRERGFEEVITPNIYKSELWERSGHWSRYKEEMFTFLVRNEQVGLKPMNCPAHALIFAQKARRHNELPLRFGEFGVVHRNELPEKLEGLTRVNRFQQDDANIFCRRDQIAAEIRACLDFLEFAYKKVFGLTFRLNLSTRPVNFIGEAAVWDEAEAELQQALDEFGVPWKLNPGDGAFYGPKIDVTIQDASGRDHQCATIQLDFQMPQRFDLHYFDRNGEKRHPVLIHRCVLGSVERMTAILAEHFHGKWPFWLSPRQVKVIAVNEKLNEYAKQVKDQLYKAGFEVDYDEGCLDDQNKQIQDAQFAQYNFILVVGDHERENGTALVRTRENTILGEVSLDNLIEKFQKLSRDYVRNNETSLLF